MSTALLHRPDLCSRALAALTEHGFTATGFSLGAAGRLLHLELTPGPAVAERLVLAVAALEAIGLSCAASTATASLSAIPRAFAA